MEEKIAVVSQPILMGKLALGMVTGLLAVLFGVGAAVISIKDSQVSPLASTNVSNSFFPPSLPRKHTSDNYPPSRYFPSQLTVRFPKAEEEINEIARQKNLGGLTSDAFAAMDRNTGELLLAKNLVKPLPIASLVKVVTALVALETNWLTKELVVSDSATQAGEAVMGLTAGERLTVEELLYGVMLPSGNDAAETLAQGLFVDAKESVKEDGEVPHKARTTFLAAMNKKAAEIGMYDSFFVNPTGLDEDSIKHSSYSTVLDLLALGNYALENPTLARIAATKRMVLPDKEGYHKAFYLTNILDFSKSYPGVKGIKPGITDFAHETLLSYAENGGKRIILVLLNSQATKDDAVKIYDYLFAKLGVAVKKGQS